ncbi:MAG: hypothetical protein KKG47_01635 [Proteobacteria bacterium]|nr:hypothetical protein [Pseudomonadota bacterium]MBU1738314.1 hypothetical protein [Pseudomonadota bacterium]
MADNENWTFKCPGCGDEIRMPVIWFKSGKGICPTCKRDISVADVEAMMNEIKEGLFSFGDDDFKLNI